MLSLNKFKFSSSQKFLNEERINSIKLSGFISIINLFLILIFKLLLIISSNGLLVSE